jgi:SHS2 domain-containing protein
MGEEPVFHEVEHTADRAFRAQGRDLRELFASAAQAMSAIQGPPSGQPATVTRDIEVRGLDRETLLVNWLNELLYQQEAHGERYERFEIVEISEQQLRARIHGHPEVAPRRIIKAVTFHNLEVKSGPEGWEATVVVDV